MSAVFSTPSRLTTSGSDPAGPPPSTTCTGTCSTSP
jgi:hypothetical protein